MGQQVLSGKVLAWGWPPGHSVCALVHLEAGQEWVDLAGARGRPVPRPPSLRRHPAGQTCNRWTHATLTPMKRFTGTVRLIRRRRSFPSKWRISYFVLTDASFCEWGTQDLYMYTDLPAGLDLRLTWRHHTIILWEAVIWQCIAGYDCFNE